jgi:hypothetical protein
VVGYDLTAHLAVNALVLLLPLAAAGVGVYEAVNWAFTR